MGYLRTRANCNWCIAVKADKKLLKRIYNSRKYTGKGESLKQIAEDVGLPYPPLTTHCKKHQFLTSDEAQTFELEKVARQTSEALVLQNVATGTARQTIVDGLMSVITSADFEALPPDKKVDLLLKATKHTDDVKAKAKDQDIDWFKAMASARSGEIRPTEIIEGELVEDFDPWAADAK